MAGPLASPDDVVTRALKTIRPYCRRCRRDVERAANVGPAEGGAIVVMVVMVECHGETAEVLVEGARVRRLLGAPQALATELMAILRVPVFEDAVRRYERFDDERDGLAEGFEAAPVRHGAGGVERLVVAVMVKAEG